MDLTHVWSGPMGTRVLAGLGAEVIKLESPAKPDTLRGNAGDIRSRYPDFEPGEDSINRNAWFNTQNVDKRDVVLDLKSSRGLEIAHQLVRHADLVIANYRPGVLERMGLGFAALSELNPRIVLVEMPGYPPDSRLASAPAFGAQFDAQSGSANLTGSPTAPLLTGFAIGDPVGGLNAASAAIAALIRARKTGEGAHIMLAQSEAMMPLLGEYFLAESVGEPIVEDLNADRRAEPHGIYRTGDGEWIALSARTDEQWRALHAWLVEQGVEVRGLEASWTLPERRQNSDRISDAMKTYASSITDTDAETQALQQHGIPAAPVAGARRLVEDEHLRSHGVLVEMEHPAVGTHRYQSLPTVIGGQRVGGRTPAPLYGQDTREVLAEVLGLDDPCIDELIASGICREAR
nr:CoA transferase [Cumulibacter soli]